LIENAHKQTGLFEKTANAFGMAGGDNALIGDEQDFGCGKFAGQVPDSLDAIDAKD
jgi:hypothetical protein